MDLEAWQERAGIGQVFLFHNRGRSGAVHKPAGRRLLPLDAPWRRDLEQIKWPTHQLPEVTGGEETTLRAFVSEYLFVSLFKACAESLLIENASRLAAMQRAEKNINEALENLGRAFHSARQSSIDEELFDLIAGFEALAATRDRTMNPSVRSTSPRSLA